MLASLPASARSILAAVAVVLLASAPSLVAAQTDGDPNTRLDRLEGQMRTLNGQIEELTHQLQVLQDELTKAEQDNELRFTDLESKAGGAPAAGASAATATAAATPPPAATAAAPAPVAQPLTPAQAVIAQSKQANNGVTPPAAGGQQLGAPPASLGTLTVPAAPGTDQPLDLSTLAGDDAGAAADQQQAALPPPAATAPVATAPAAAVAPAAGAQVAALAPTGDPQADYDTAYKLITAGRYDVAETAFRQFLTAYPTDPQAPDAQYWLGESLYSRGDYRGAGQQFQAVFQKYPKSKRAPDALLKLGLSLAGLGQTADACKMYALDLKQFPTMSNALRQRVVTEQGSASC